MRRLENEKEIKFLEELSERFENINKTIGDLERLPTADKTSIVNSIRSLTAGTVEPPKIDPDEIITKFRDKLNS